MERRPHLAVLQQHGAVEQRPSDLVRDLGVATPTSNGGPSFSSAAMRASISPLRSHESAAHQQIAGQVPHEGQLGRHRQVRRLGLRRAGPADNQRRIPVESPAVGLI